MKTTQRLVSGIQPTGKIHFGSYFGAIEQWLQLQSDYEAFFFIADLHAITTAQPPQTLRACCYETTAMLLACGINPEQATLFIQSHVPEHSQLAWLSICHSTIGELTRMTQFKDKSKHQQHIPTGLFAYPALMSADILLYQADLVPVGEDQKQHLELTRNLAERMNNRYGPVFRIPNPLIPQTGARVMGMQRPTDKMSKSSEHANDCIYLLDSPDIIRRKVMRAVTDSTPTISYEKSRPGLYNLLNLLARIQKKSAESLVPDYQGKGFAPLKADLADALISIAEPIQSQYHHYMSDFSYLDQVLANGAKKARSYAANTLNQVYNELGFIHNTL